MHFFCVGFFVPGRWMMMGLYLRRTLVLLPKAQQNHCPVLTVSMILLLSKLSDE
jgi:hypothetical protein